MSKAERYLKAAFLISEFHNEVYNATVALKQQKKHVAKLRSKLRKYEIFDSKIMDMDTLEVLTTKQIRKLLNDSCI